MNERDRDVAVELKERLATVVTLIDFRIFGSRARGDEDEDSDLDVFIEVESLDRIAEDQVEEVVWEIGLRHGLLISPFIVTRKEIEETPLRSAPIVLNILEEGVRP